MKKIKNKTMWWDSKEFPKKGCNLYKTLPFFLCIFSFCMVHADVNKSKQAEIRNKFHSEKKEQLYLARFPYEAYKMCYVEGLGDFYIDDVTDSIKWHLRQGIYWEGRIGNLIRRYCEPDSVVVDVGAHIGIHTLTMSQKVGEGGLVVAFEPQKKIFRELYHNLLLNRSYENVVCLRHAAGEERRLIQMDISDPINEGGTKIGSGGDLAEMITIDSLKLENVSLIKIDVELYEDHVIEGAIETIHGSRPILIVEIQAGNDPENCSREVEEKFNHSIGLLKSCGYWVIRIFGNDYIAFPSLI